MAPPQNVEFETTDKFPVFARQGTIYQSGWILLWKNALLINSRMPDLALIGERGSRRVPNVKKWSNLGFSFLTDIAMRNLS